MVVSKKKLVLEVRILSADARKLLYDMLTLMQKGQRIEAFKLLVRADTIPQYEVKRFFDVILGLAE